MSNADRVNPLFRRPRTWVVLAVVLLFGSCATICLMPRRPDPNHVFSVMWLIEPGMSVEEVEAALEQSPFHIIRGKDLWSVWPSREAREEIRFGTPYVRIHFDWHGRVESVDAMDV